MKIVITCITALWFSPFVLFCQTMDTARTRIYLIGDTGKKAETSQNYKQFSEFISRDTPSCVLFLGDNIYPKGIRPEGHKHHAKDMQKMAIQLDMLKNHRGHIYMIPGNHDWQMGKMKGLEYVQRQSDVVNQYLRQNMPQYTEGSAHYFKYAGLPGPEKVELEGVTLIMIDTDWWIHKQLLHPVKLIDNSIEKTETYFFQKFDTYLSEAQQKGQKIVVVAHHPLYLTGANSVHLEPLRFLITYTPLKIMGMAGLNRAARGMAPQPNYKRLVKKFEEHLAPYPQVTWVSGHDHDQQLIIKKNITQVICGNGGSIAPVKKREGIEWYNDSTQGFGKIELGTDGKLTLFFYDDYGRTLLKRAIGQ